MDSSPLIVGADSSIHLTTSVANRGLLDQPVVIKRTANQRKVYYQAALPRQSQGEGIFALFYVSTGGRFMGQLKDWIPFFSGLIWPVFIIIVLLVFKEQVTNVFTRIESAIGEGRSVEVGEWLKIGEKTSIAELSSKRASEVGQNIDISIESVGGYQEFVEKGSYVVLERLREQLRNSPTQRIDVLLVTSNKQYSTKLLSSYITTLGIRFVVFQNQNQFDGWIDSGLFNSQLPTNQDDSKSYEQLRSEILGIRQNKVSPSDSAVEVLKAMDQANTENIAVVENNQFRFIANRENILSKLITATLFQN